MVKIEADGDLHLDLQDATGDKASIVVCEVPAKPQWYQLRQIVLVGRTYSSHFAFDLGEIEAYSTVDYQSYRQNVSTSVTLGRINLAGFAAWEVHPVMKLTVQ